MLSEYPEVLTTDEAAELLRVGFNTLYDLLQSGKLKAYRNGRNPAGDVDGSVYTAPEKAQIQPQTAQVLMPQLQA